MPKKRIAIIGLKGLPPFGGAANVGDNIIEQLSKDYDFTIYATASHTHHKGDYKGAHQIVFRKFPVKRLNVFFYYIASAFHAVFARRYDAIHLHHLDGAFTLFLLRLRYKVVATSHGLPYLNDKWSKWVHPYFKLNQLLQARLSNHLTVCTKSLLPHYEKLTPTTRISYIPNGVTITGTPIPGATSIPTAPISGAASAPTTPIPGTPATGAPTTTPPAGYLLYAAGRIIPSKGLHFLLSALRILNYKGKLIVCGDHSQLKDYSRELFDLAAGLDVEFKGLIKEKPLLNAWIAGASLFIFPSTYEGMSMMLLEVASLRTPVICSDIVQNTDVFEPDEMLFFRSGSDADLAAKLEWALNHPDTMRTFAEKAYASLMEKHQWSIIARQYAEIFDRLTS